MTSPPSVLIVDTCYPAFLRASGFHDIAGPHDNYDELLDEFMKLRFGTSDVYSKHLTALGWTAREIIPNSLRLQSAWAHRHDIPVSPRLGSVPHALISRVPVLRSVSRHLPALHRVLESQVDDLRPNVLYFQDLNFTPPSLLRRLRKRVDLIVGQIASPLPPARILQSYDIILSSLPNQIEQIRALGIDSEFLAIGFDDRIVSEIPQTERDLPLTFVGGVSRNHSTTLPLLLEVGASVPDLQIYGYGSSDLPNELRARHGGERWGVDMYRVLMRSQITLNRHIDVARGFANNMRLFESTGCGALLVTDRGRNLDQYFSEDEVLSYSTPHEAIQQIEWARTHPEESRAMRLRAQRRTLDEHSYARRMADLDRILRARLPREHRASACS